MTILEVPQPSTSFRSWQNIASGFGLFCVQERTAAGQAEGYLSKRLRGYGSKPVDTKLFRIIFSHCPVDFLSISEKENTRVPHESLFGSSQGAQRLVVAVSNSLSDVLEDWSWVMRGWQAAYVSPAVKSTSAALSKEEWAPVYAYIKNHLALEEGPESEAPLPGIADDRVAAAVNSSVFTPPLSEASATPAESQVFDAEVTTTTTPAMPATLLSRADGGSDVWTDGAAADPFYQYSVDLFDIMALRIIDAWTWSDPHCTLLILFCAVMRSWLETLIFACTMALPLSILQRRRGGDARRRARDQKYLHRLTKISKVYFPFLNTPSDAAADDSESDGILQRVMGIAQSRLGFLLALAAVIYLGLSLLLPPGAAPGQTLGKVAEKVLAASLLCTAAYRIYRPSAATHAPLSRKAIAAVMQSVQRNAHPHMDDLTYRYVSPTLSIAEQTLVDQLRNFGAPYSVVLLRPLRELAVSTGWRQLHHDALRTEQRVGVDGSTTMRYTVNIPHANVGTLQAALLDDPEGRFGATRSSNIYTWDHLLVERTVVKQLDHDLQVVRSRFRSCVWGAPPTEMVQYYHPGILLDEQQQEALRLREYVWHPTNCNNNNHSNSVSSSTVAKRQRYAFIACGIPCEEPLEKFDGVEVPEKPASEGEVKSSAGTHMLLGMEEDDGSLTFCFLVHTKKPEMPSQWLEMNLAERELCVYRLCAFLRTIGPQPNQLAEYNNERGFQPFLCRQPFTDSSAPEEPKDFSSLSFIEGGVGGRRNDEGATVRPPNKDGEVPRQRSLRFVSEEPLPPLCRQVLQEVMDPKNWRLVAHREGVQQYTAARPLSGDSRKHSVMCSRVTVAAPLVEVVRTMSRNDLASTIHRHVDRRITLGDPVTLAELLANVADGEDDDCEMQKGGAAVAPTISTVMKRIGRERMEHGNTIVYTSITGILASHDMVERQLCPYYLAAKSVRQHLFSGTEAEPLTTLMELPPDAPIYVIASEDAATYDKEDGDAAVVADGGGDILPPLKDHERLRGTRHGVVCWEVTHGEGAAAQRQTIVVQYTAYQGRLWLPTCIAARLWASAQRQSCNRLRILAEKLSKRSTAAAAAITTSTKKVA